MQNLRTCASEYVMQHQFLHFNSRAISLLEVTCSIYITYKYLGQKVRNQKNTVDRQLTSSSANTDRLKKAPR